MLSRAQIVTGAAMLIGTTFGAWLAQVTDLGVPYMVRSALLGLTLVAALIWMHDPRCGGHWETRPRFAAGGDM